MAEEYFKTDCGLNYCLSLQLDEPHFIFPLFRSDGTGRSSVTMESVSIVCSFFSLMTRGLTRRPFPIHESGQKHLRSSVVFCRISAKLFYFILNYFPPLSHNVFSSAGTLKRNLKISIAEKKTKVVYGFAMRELILSDTEYFDD